MTETLLQADPPEQLDPRKNYLEDLVGDGKKFKTPEDLAKGKYEADLFIKSLEKEQAQMRKDYLEAREELQKRATLEELYERISQQRQLSDSTPKTQEETRQPQQIDPNQLKNQIVSEMKRDDNFKMVRDKLKERYGNKYSSVLQDQLAELGMSSEEADHMARSNPNVFIRTFGLDKPVQAGETFEPPIRSSRTDSFTPNVPKKTWSYYENLRRTQPEVYWDPKTQIEIHQMSNALGKEFEDSYR